MKKKRVEVAKVSAGSGLWIGSKGGKRQGESETDKVVIRERKGCVREVAGSAAMGEYEVESVAVGVSGGLCPLC